MVQEDNLDVLMVIAFTTLQAVKSAVLMERGFTVAQVRKWGGLMANAFTMAPDDK
jgi:hypothetical protein